ncbi:hypothetical protein H8E07_00220 [bacterium]|nr:hypothetical protein [bacterium]
MRTKAIVSVLLLSAVLATAASARIDSFFDIWTEASLVAGPPYPACCHEGAVGHPDAAGSIVTDGGLSVALSAATDQGSGAPLAAHLDAGPGGDFNVDSFFDITYDFTKQDFVVDSFFDITYDFHSSTGPATLVPEVPGAPGNNPESFFDITYVDSFFDITYRVEFGPGVQHDLHLHGSVPDGLRIRSATIPPRDFTIDSFFDIWVEVSLDGSPAPGAAALHMTQTGTFVENPVAEETATWSAVKSIYED